MLSGSNKERVTYDQLTMGQWMAGFCRAMREETDKNSQNLMLDYLIALLDDSNNFSWASAKASHAVLLCRMEQGAFFTSIYVLSVWQRVEKISHILKVIVEQKLKNQ